MLSVILVCYKDLYSRVTFVSMGRISSPERVEAVLRESIGRVTKSQILDLCPDISKVTVERVLKDLVESGKIKKVGGGRSTSYVRHRSLRNKE